MRDKIEQDMSSSQIVCAPVCTPPACNCCQKPSLHLCISSQAFVHALPALTFLAPICLPPQALVHIFLALTHAGSHLYTIMLHSCCQKPLPPPTSASPSLCSPQFHPLRHFVVFFHACSCQKPLLPPPSARPCPWSTPTPAIPSGAPLTLQAMKLSV